MKNAHFLLIALFAFALTSCGDDPYEMQEFEQSFSEENASPDFRKAQDAQVQANQDLTSAYEETTEKVEKAQQDVNGQHDLVIGCFNPNTRLTIEIEANTCSMGKETYTLKNTQTGETIDNSNTQYGVTWMTEDGMVLEAGSQLNCFCGTGRTTVMVSDFENDTHTNVEFTPVQCSGQE